MAKQVEPVVTSNKLGSFQHKLEHLDKTHNAHNQQQCVAPQLSLKQPTGSSLFHTPLQTALPSKQGSLASSIILTLSVLPLAAQNVSSSPFAGNVEGKMAIYMQ